MFSNTNYHRSINGLCLTLLLCECNSTSDLCAKSKAEEGLLSFRKELDDNIVFNYDDNI